LIINEIKENLKDTDKLFTFKELDMDYLNENLKKKIEESGESIKSFLIKYGSSHFNIYRGGIVRLKDFTKARIENDIRGTIETELSKKNVQNLDISTIVKIINDMEERKWVISTFGSIENFYSVFFDIPYDENERYEIEKDSFNYKNTNTSQMIIPLNKKNELPKQNIPINFSVFPDFVFENPIHYHINVIYDVGSEEFMKIFSNTHIVVDILSNEDEETYLLQITHLFKSDNQEIFFIWLQSLSDFSMTLKIIFEKSNIYKIFFNYERYKNQMDNINTKNTIYVENIVDMYKTICGSNIAYKYTNIISYYNKFNLEKLQGLLSKKTIGRDYLDFALI